MRKTKHWLITTTMLLFSLAMNAYEAGDFVYTKVARYKITGENLVVNGQFNQGATGTDGWTATSETLPLEATFTMGVDGPNGSNTQKVLAGQTALENGMYQKLAITQGGTYVVSFKVKGATAGFTDLDLTAGNTNYMNAYYNTDGTLATVSGTTLLYGENGVNGGYQFDYSADGFTNVSFAVEAPAEGYIMIDFRGLAEGLEIADVTCHSAENVYDDRIAKNRIAYIKLFLAEEGTEEKEYYEELQACIKTIEDAVQENASLSAMEECMGTLENTWQMFIDENFQSIIDAVPTTDGSENTGNSSANWMNWTAKYNTLNSGYAGKAPWTWSTNRWGHLSAKSNSSMSVRWQRGAINQWDNVATLTVTLPAGVYYWGVTGQGGMMTLNKSRWMRSWANECAMTQLSADDEYSETFVLNAARNEDYVFRFELTEKKEVSLRIRCNIEESSINGCFAEFYSPILYQVIESDQLTAEQMLFLDEVSNLLNELKGRLDVANEYLADTQVLMPWGKETLQEETDKVQLSYDTWAALTQEELLEIFDNDEDLCGAIYTETGNLNTSIDLFTELNIPLTDMPTAIDEAQSILEMRRYASSSLMDEFEAMITKTQTMYEEYLKIAYSVAAAETLIAQKAALEAMTEDFMEAINVEVLVDIDFGTQNNPASFETVEYTDDAGAINYYYTITGAKGTMTFTDITGSYPYALGWGSLTDESGAIIPTDSLGILRVGNSEAIAKFDGAPAKETGIVNIKFDLYAGSLIKSMVGYKVLAAGGETICGLFYSPYSGNDDMNTFGINYWNLPRVGSGSASNSAIAAASNRIQFDIVLDYGAKTMYCTTSSSKGVDTSQIIPLPDLVPAQFVLYSNYNNADRRCWFDNLIIQNISTEPASEETVISGKCGENLTWTLDGSELTIAGSGDMYNYTTSPWVDYSIEKVTIEDGVTSIGERAFYDCSSLASITLPEGITSIGNSTFRNCSNLTSITLPKGVTSIGSSTFQNCNNLTSITLPEGVTSIGSSAFFDCSSLTSITLPEGMTYVDWSTFRGCSNLFSITIPQSVTSIGNYAFAECRSISSITIPEKVTNIASGTFLGCSNLTSIAIPEGVKSIEPDAFSYCSSLTSTIIPKDVTSIGERAFYGCTSLTSINIPEGVTSIADYTFQGCSSLVSIAIPKNVTSISSSAFNNCSSLNAIVVAEDNATYDSREECNAIIEKNSNTLIAGCYTTIIPTNILHIGESAFCGCTNLTFITIPENVTSIGNGAFSGCSNLASINIPESVTSIANHTFYGCSSLYAISIPKGVTTIGEWSFNDCSNLTSITIPERVTSIGSSAFSGHSSLTTITCEAVAPPAIGDSYTFNNVNKSIPVYVPATSVSAYQTADYWKEFTNIQALTPTTETITINQYGSGTYCSEYTLDFSDVEGLKAYAATGYDTETGIVTLTRVMTAKAGMGLFLKGAPGEYEVPVLENTSYNTLNMLVGTQENTVVNSTSDDGIYANYKYTIQDGDAAPMFYQFSDGSTLGAGKAYLQIPFAWLPAVAKSISLRFDDGETTDIEEIESLEQSSDVIYDLMGRRVTMPQRGSLYMINGKKIIY